METITFLSFYRAAYLRRGPRTIENGRLFANSKQNIYVWNLKLQDYRQEHKSYLQQVKVLKLLQVCQKWPVAIKNITDLTVEAGYSAR